MAAIPRSDAISETDRLLDLVIGTSTARRRGERMSSARHTVARATRAALRGPWVGRQGIAQVLPIADSGPAPLVAPVCRPMDEPRLFTAAPDWNGSGGLDGPQVTPPAPGPAHRRRSRGRRRARRYSRAWCASNRAEMRSACVGLSAIGSARVIAGPSILVQTRDDRESLVDSHGGALTSGLTSSVRRVERGIGRRAVPGRQGRAGASPGTGRWSGPRRSSSRVPSASHQRRHRIGRERCPDSAQFLSSRTNGVSTAYCARFAPDHHSDHQQCSSRPSAAHTFQPSRIEPHLARVGVHLA